MQEEVLVFEGIQVRIIRRRRTRRLCLRVESYNSARLSCPKRAPLRLLHAFMQSRRQWVIEHNEKAKKWAPWRQRKGHLGEPYLYRGKELKLQDAITVLPKPFIAAGNPNPDALHFYWPERDFARREHLRSEVFRNLLKFFDTEAESYLTTRAAAVSGYMNLRPNRIRFRNQKSRWGSCNSAGTISLNRRLIGAPEWVVDAVLVHEFAHLRFLNHGDEFWQLVKTYCPQHDEADQWLNENQFCFL